LLKEWTTNRGEKAEKAFKRWNDKAKELLAWKTQWEIFEATKLVIETQHGANPWG